MFSLILKKNRLILSLFFILIFTHKNALSKKLEFIDQQLKNADIVRSSNPQQFNRIINQLEKNRRSLSSEQTHYLNYLLAYHQSISGKLASSVQSYKSIINSDASKKLKFRANSSIINTFAITQNWTEGLFYLTKNLEMLKSFPDGEAKQTGLITAAIFYNLIGQYELGFKYSSIGLANIENPRLFCIANQLNIEAKFKLKRVNIGSKEIGQAIESCEKVNEVIMTSQIHAYLARLHIDNGNNLKAEEILINRIKPIEKSKYAPVIAMYYALLAEIFFEKNNYRKAALFANKTLTKTSDSGNSKALISAYLLLYKINLKNGFHEEALDNYVKYSEANNAHLEGEKAKYLAFQLAENQAFEQESQIKLLNEKNNALAAEQSLAKTQAANRKLIILLLGLVILAFTFVGIRFCRSHKRVKELAEYDPLTGIYNRGHFTHVTNSALKYCKNAQQDLSVIMFDLDHFKKVNDSFGHACGDWALKETIKVCQNIGRKNDIFARLGGEEFCLVLTSCTIDVAMLRAEACRAAIEEIITEESGCEFSITASFGVTDLKRSGFNLDKLLADADMAAYASKNAGRNRVTMFEVPETSQPKKLDNSWNYEK